jgi:nicotinate-nucleotide adenylyltransferase
VDRAGPTYTLDTVRQLQAAEPHADWFLVIGQDQYAGLHTWNQWRELLGKVTLAVANRPGNVPPVDAEVRRFPHRAVPLEMMDISSTDIRQRAATGLPIEHLVPAAVASYIALHHLYTGPPGHHRS